MKLKEINGLKQQGYKFFTDHYRELIGEQIVNNGGKTVVTVTTPSGDVVVGESICHKKDLFNKKIGRQIAIGRALKKLNK